MARLAFAVAVLALIAAASAAPWAKVRVRESVSAAGSGIVGWVNFESNSTTTWVTVDVQMGAPWANRALGIHIHQFADMVTLSTASAFDAGNKTFGTHWQGAGSTAFGCAENSSYVFPNYRAGCLGNWDVDSSGNILQTKYYPIEQIAPTSSNSQGALSSPIGLGLIIHNNTDPCNGISTAYGARLAGGVIGSANGAINVTSYTTGKTMLTATCRLIGTTNSTLPWAGVRGSVWFRQNSLASITIRANISGIDLGTSLARSMHVHDYGDLSDLLDGLRTGGHWNPHRANHSLPNDEPRHAGDLGRITVTSNGNIWYEYTLTSTGNTAYHPLLSDPYSILGRGMILHAGRDEGCAAPTTNGAAGARAAQCVIGLARDEVWEELNAVWPALTMPAQVGRAACSAPVAANAPMAANAPVAAGTPVARTPVRSSAGVVVPSILAAVLAVFAFLF